MTAVGFFASEPHYVEHIAPIWHALPPEQRAWFSVANTKAAWRAEQLDVPVILERHGKIKRRGSEPTVVAGFHDLRKIGRRPAIFVEHGAGQSYPDGGLGHPNYSGGRNRGQVAAFLCPNRAVAHRNGVAYPGVPTFRVGCPKLDHLRALRRARVPSLSRKVTVAVSFHFDAPAVAPEARWAFPHYRQAIADLAGCGQVNVLGHGHPRAMPHLRGFWRQLGVPVAESFDQVVEQADVYVCDNSSTIFEAAAVGLPALMLNAPWYRRDVEQGLRFWRAADFLPMVDEPEDLLRGIAAAQSPRVEAACAELAAEVYDHATEEHAAADAAYAISLVTARQPG